MALNNNELVRRQRPTKVMRQKDVNPSNLEKIFQYYDKQIAKLEKIIENYEKEEEQS